MSTIKLPLRYEGSQGEKTLYTLFDNGATYSCVRMDIASKLGGLVPLRRPKIFVANGCSVESENVVLLDFYVNGVLLSDEFMAVPDLSEEVVLGELTFRKWRIKVDFESGSIDVNPKVAKLMLKDLK